MARATRTETRVFETSYLVQDRDPIEIHTGFSSLTIPKPKKKINEQFDTPEEAAEYLIRALACLQNGFHLQVVRIEREVTDGQA